MGSFSVNRIAKIIGNKLLAKDICTSIETAIEYPGFTTSTIKTVWRFFLMSLDAAIRDIDSHPKGKLLRRLIEFGPANSIDPQKHFSDNNTYLSDLECSECVEFIFSHMVNRFKGELAELLALKPCLELITDLQRREYLPFDLSIAWGDFIKERRQLNMNDQDGKAHSAGFSKGADGLIFRKISEKNEQSATGIEILGIIEIKSIKYSVNKIKKQIQRHYNRLQGGIKLGNKVWPPEKVLIVTQKDKSPISVVNIMVIPSSWKLSRKWKFASFEKRQLLIPPSYDLPPVPSISDEILPCFWKITLAWSEEALHQAAYEMTFWYMSQIGRHIYNNKHLPSGWEDMSPEEAGFNAIKMMLYYLPMQNISKRQLRNTIKLYNVYCFGFPIGVDSKEMLWPRDINSC